MFKNFSRFVLVVAAIAVIGLTANVQADAIYDFDGNVGTPLSTGQLNGQDGWLKTNLAGDDLSVAENVTGWTDKILQGLGADSASYRVNNTNWSYDIVEGQDFDVSAEFATRSGSWVFLLGLQNHATAGSEYGYTGMVFGINTNCLAWYNNGTGAGQYIKPALSVPSGTELKYLIGFHATWQAGGGYLMEAYYQNLSDPGSIKQSAGTLTLATDPTQWDQLLIRMRTTQTGCYTKLDNITISQVPEPSTLALLACGLMGLLAYAWRKRK